MASLWSSDQIISLAPDPGSVKAARDLASLPRWVRLGHNGESLWGECQGSGKNPYQTQIDLSDPVAGPAFKCSCPSRKFPCKHALALFLLFAAQPTAFLQQNPPEWVSTWLDSRRSRASQKSGKAQGSAQTPTKSTVKTKVRSEKTAAHRQARVDEGVKELRIWLHDLVRQGLSGVQAKPLGFWEVPASRMVNAQAPGLARKIRQFAALNLVSPGWQERVLEHAARLYLLLEAYDRLAALPEPLQVEVRQQVGWTENQEELLAQTGCCDRWIVLAHRIYEESIASSGRSPGLRVQRIWLWGRERQSHALLLHFAAPGQSLDVSLVPGTELDAELVFFPGSYPLRALVKNRLSPPEPALSFPGFPNLELASSALAGALAENPWIEVFPLSLTGVLPVNEGDNWTLCDSLGHRLPVHPQFAHSWQLFALSGGTPLAVFGEWNLDNFLPLAVCADQRWITYPVL